MRKITLSKFYIHLTFTVIAYFLGVAISNAQCPIVNTPNQSFCDLQAPTVASLSATNNGNPIFWYANAVGGSALSNTQGLVNGEDYFADNAAGNCGTRTSVIVSIYEAPTAQGFQGPCVDDPSEATISDLTATGNNIRWYTTAAGGTALAPTTVLNNNTFYYASQTNPITNCETSRRPVLVRVGVVPTPTGSATQQFCNTPGNQPTIANIVVSGQNNNWYASPSSPIILPVNTPLVNGATYYATTVDLPCESAVRFGVTVTLVQPNNPGINGNRSICVSNLSTTPPFNLFNLLGGNPNSTGTWTGPLPTTNGNLGTVNVSTLTLAGSPYVFTYTVSSAVCPSASSTVTLTILPLPVATMSLSTTTICAGNSATITVNGTPNATVNYTLNGVAGSITLNSTGTATIVGNYSETTIIILTGVTSASSPACTQVLNQTLTLSVIPLPMATIGADPSNVCSGGSSTVTISGTPNGTVIYTVNGNSQTILLNASGTATIVGNYLVTTQFTLVSISTAGTPSCTKNLNQSITVNVIPPPTATISASPITICSGNSSSVIISGTPNATVVFTIGGVQNTIILNAAGTASIPGNYTAATVFSLVSVTTAGTPSCTKLLNQTLTLNVLPLPTATISAAPLNICSGGNSTVTITGTPNSTVTYTVNGLTQSSILGATGIAVIPGTFPTATTFVLVSITTNSTPSCTQVLNQSITITVIPLPTATFSASPLIICSGSPSTVTITGTPNATVSYTTNGASNVVVLNASGSAVVIGNLLATTNFTLVSVATAGTPSCIQNLNQTLTVNVIPPPTAVISAAPIEICSGNATTVTINGTPNAIVNFTINGIQNTVTLAANGSAIIQGPFLAATTFTLLNVTTAGTPSCSQILNQTLALNVIPLPTASITATPTTICASAESTVTFAGTPNATVSYTQAGVVSTIVLNNSGSATVTGNYTQPTTFTLISVTSSGTPSCTRVLNQTVVISVVPLPTATISAVPQSICSGNQSVVTITGTPNAIVNYTQDNVANTITLSASGTAIISGSYTSNSIFVLLNVSLPGNPTCLQILNQTLIITVVPLPTATIVAAPLSICSGTSSFINITGTPAGLVTYTVNGATQTLTLNNLGNAIIPGNFTINTTINLVSITLPGTTDCTNILNSSISISVTQPAIAGNNATFSLCANAAPQNLFLLLGSNAQTGGVWTPTLSSGTGVFNPILDPAGTYTYTVLGTAPCPNASASVTVSITEPVNAGTNSSQTICSNVDAIDLFTLLGGNPQSNGTWFPTLTSGSGIFNPSIDPAGIYTYTVSGTPPCANASSTVTISIIPGPNAGISGVANFCENSPAADLFLSLGGSPEVGGVWSPALASGSGIFNPAIDPAGIYSYTFSGSQPCDDDVATITVTINPVPEAGENGSAFFCSNYQPTDLFLNLGGNPQSGGIWSPALASGTGLFNPLIDVSGIYTYTVGGGLCATDVATVTVSVVQSPNAGGIDANLLIQACATNASVDLNTGLNGTQGVGIWTDDLATGALSGNIFNASQVGPGTYLFTYTVSGGVSPCLTDSATVTVIVSEVPNAGIAFAPQNYCNANNTVNLFNLITGNQLGGDWTNSSNLVVGNIVDILTLAAGVYIYTYIITNGCGTDSETVQFAIIPQPVITSSNINVSNPVCIGSDLTVSVNGLTGGNYLINYGLTGSNSIAEQNIDITVVNGIGLFTIPSASISNSGSTTITIFSIANSLTNCVTQLTDVTKEFLVRPIPTLTNALISVNNFCLGVDALVNISAASGLEDGIYQFSFTIPLANPSSGNAFNVIVNSGVAQFSIPAGAFVSSGTYSIVITAISSSVACSNTSVNAGTSFEVYAVPILTSASVSANSVCQGFSNEVSISNATTLIDGNYTINYILSGANSATTAVQVTFTNGNSSFSIPLNELINPGITTLTISQLASVTGQCGISGAAFNPVSFEVEKIGTPILNEKGNEFCATDNPTIAELTAAVSDEEIVIWYDSASDGNVLSPTTLLQNGTTYFASFASATGCESVERLSVKVDLTKCDDFFVPDGFSPNNDGINDAFVIRNLREKYPNFRLEIYNRYGSLLYKGNANIPDWTGTTTENGLKIGGNQLPVGVYFYILEFNDGVQKPKQGRVYLSR